MADFYIGFIMGVLSAFSIVLFLGWLETRRLRRRAKLHRKLSEKHSEAMKESQRLSQLASDYANSVTYYYRMGMKKEAEECYTICLELLSRAKSLVKQHANILDKMESGDGSSEEADTSQTDKSTEIPPG